MFINGVCAHQDLGLTGLAVPENIAKYKMKLIKEMGANGYRTSHYQQTSAYLDACDEMGILVMDEARWFESTKESFEQLESLIKRDRNRPSVIFWSTSNEEPNHITDVGKRIHRAVAEDKRTTTGNAVSLRLTSCNEFEANGRDLALFTCECLDENGNVVPDASEYVRFSVNAPAKIIGTGSDNCDHNNVANNERKMFMGKILVAVKPAKDQKIIKLTAMSDNCGVTSAKITL